MRKALIAPMKVDSFGFAAATDRNWRRQLYSANFSGHKLHAQCVRLE
jgi:hypothetical protein